MAKLKRQPVTWIVCKVSAGGAEKPIGQFCGGDNPARALRFARKHYGRLVEKTSQIRVYPRPEK